MSRSSAPPALLFAAMQPVYHPQVVPLGPATSSAVFEAQPAAASLLFSSLASCYTAAAQFGRRDELSEAGAFLQLPARVLPSHSTRPVLPLAAAASDSRFPSIKSEAQEETAAAAWAASGQAQRCPTPPQLPYLQHFQCEQQPLRSPVKMEPAETAQADEANAAAGCLPPDDGRGSFSASGCSTLSPPSSSYPMWDSRPPSPSSGLSPDTQASNRSIASSSSHSSSAAAAGGPPSPHPEPGALSPAAPARDDTLFAVSSPTPRLGTFLLSGHELQQAASEQPQAGAAAADGMDDIERCCSSSRSQASASHSSSYFALSSEQGRMQLMPRTPATASAPCAAGSAYQLCMPALPIVSTGAVMGAGAAGQGDCIPTFCMTHQCDHEGGVAVEGGCVFSCFTAPLLRAMHSRTIAARLTEGSTGSDSDERPIIVSQQSEEPQQQRRKRSRGARRSAVPKKRRARAGSNKENSASRSRQRQDGDIQCEHCGTRAADPEYGTGRFCGPKCARTFSIEKRYHKAGRLQAKEREEQTSGQAARLAAACRRLSGSSAAEASSFSAAPSPSSVASSPASAESESSGDEEQPGMSPSGGRPAVADTAADVTGAGFADVTLCCYCGAACGSAALVTAPSGQFCSLRCANLLAQQQKDCKGEGVKVQQEAAETVSR